MTSTIPQRRLGDLEVSAVGMGAMTLTQVAGFDVERGQRTVRAALEAGITLFDTADTYGPSGYGVNEEALAAALRSCGSLADGVVVATKGGHTRDGELWWIDGRRDYLKQACRASMRRLGLDVLPLYQHHRPDPKIPFAESMGALSELHEEGLVERVGISNADEAQIREAREILGDALVSVQNEFSPAFRSSAGEIDVCEELGLAFLSWSPLGGMRAAKDLGPNFAAFAQIADERGVSPQRIALAWALGKSDCVIPIPGASRPESVLDSVQALDLVLTADEVTRLDTPTPR